MCKANIITLSHIYKAPPKQNNSSGNVSYSVLLKRVFDLSQAWLVTIADSRSARCSVGIAVICVQLGSERLLARAQNKQRIKTCYRKPVDISSYIFTFSVCSNNSIFLSQCVTYHGYVTMTPISWACHGYYHIRLNYNFHYQSFAKTMNLCLTRHRAGFEFLWWTVLARQKSPVITA